MRRVDDETGELLVPWTRFDSQKEAAAAFAEQGLNATGCSELARGVKRTLLGFEVRRCDHDGASCSRSFSGKNVAS